jgi:hypothetical protein
LFSDLHTSAIGMFSFAHKCNNVACSHAAAKGPAHGGAVGAHRRDARRCPRRLARSSERMGSNGGEKRHGPSYESIRSYAR